MGLSWIFQRKRASLGACFAVVLAGGLMSGCAAQSASFACEMPLSEEAIALCAAVEAALGASLGVPVTRVEAGADYTLLVQAAKPVSIVARLDTAAQEGPLLGVTVSDRETIPARVLVKFAGKLVASLTEGGAR